MSRAVNRPCWVNRNVKTTQHNAIVASLIPSDKKCIFKISNTYGCGPPLLRQTLLELGFKEHDARIHDECQWNLWWKGCRFKPEEINSTTPTQRINHHPAPIGQQADIIRKDGLLRAVRQMCLAYPKCIRLLPYPVSFHLPREEAQFISRFCAESQTITKESITTKCETHEGHTNSRSTSLDRLRYPSERTVANSPRLDDPTMQNIWIVKPADMSRGRGIYLIDRLDSLVYYHKSVIQKYITNPLLVNGYKFDLRIYVVVPSYAPFFVYIYSDGLVRFATEPFDLKDLKNVYSHLTNSSINVNGPAYSINKRCIGRGCKWTFSQLRRWMRDRNLNDQVLWIRIQALIILTLLSQAGGVVKVCNAYEIFGFDVLVDQCLRPWLIEVNANPSMTSDCIVDELVKKPLIAAVMKMLQLPHMNSERCITITDGEAIDCLIPSSCSDRQQSAIGDSRNNVRSRDTRCALPYIHRGSLTSRPYDNANALAYPFQERQKLVVNKETLRERKSRIRLEDRPLNMQLDTRAGHGYTVLDRMLKSIMPSHLKQSSTLHRELADLALVGANKRPGRKDHSLPSANEAKPRQAHGRGIALGQYRLQSEVLNGLNNSVLRCPKPEMMKTSNGYPLYGPGSEILFSKLKELAKWSHVLDNMRRKSPTNIKSVDSWCRHNKNSSDFTVSIIRSTTEAVSAEKTGRFLIPHAFGQLKLAFPFNMSTRIACAHVSGGNPDTKAIVCAIHRLTQHAVRESKEGVTRGDLSVIDIPRVWESLS